MRGGKQIFLPPSFVALLSSKPGRATHLGNLGLLGLLLAASLATVIAALLVLAVLAALLLIVILVLGLGSRRSLLPGLLLRSVLLTAAGGGGGAAESGGEKKRVGKPSIQNILFRRRIRENHRKVPYVRVYFRGGNPLPCSLRGGGLVAAGVLVHLPLSAAGSGGDLPAHARALPHAHRNHLRVQRHFGEHGPGKKETRISQLNSKQNKELGMSHLNSGSRAERHLFFRAEWIFFSSFCVKKNESENN